MQSQQLQGQEETTPIEVPPWQGWLLQSFETQRQNIATDIREILCAGKVHQTAERRLLAASQRVDDRVCKTALADGGSTKNHGNAPAATECRGSSMVYVGTIDTNSALRSSIEPIMCANEDVVADGDARRSTQFADMGADTELAGTQIADMGADTAGSKTQCVTIRTSHESCESLNTVATNSMKTQHDHDHHRVPSERNSPRISDTVRSQNTKASSIGLARDLITFRLTHNKAGQERNYLDTFVSFCIIANTVCMLVELEWSGYKARVDIGMQADEGAWNNATFWFFVVEHVFNAIFLIEMFIRLCSLRCAYFRDASNAMDMFLVVTTSCQLYILDPLAFSVGQKMTLFRLLRFVRTVRVLRMVRMLRFFTELRILVQTFVISIRALVWSMVFLFLVIILGALFLSYSLQDVMFDKDAPHDLRVFVYKHYGSAFLSIYTLFEVTLAGCWPNYFRPLIERVSAIYSIFVIFYISVVVFAVTRIITALFLKQTLQAADNDAEQRQIELTKKKREATVKLKEIFEAIDTSGDGMVSKDEFDRIVESEEAIVHLKMLELDVSNVEALFNLLDMDMSGEISFKEFLNGVTRLKGQARSLDIVSMMRANDVVCMNVSLLLRKMEDLHRFFRMDHVERQSADWGIQHAETRHSFSHMDGDTADPLAPTTLFDMELSDSNVAKLLL